MEEKNTIYADFQEGLDSLFSNSFEEAGEFFRKRRDVSPRFALHYAEVFVFRAIMFEEYASRQTAIDLLNDTISLASDQIKIFEQDQIPEEREDINDANFHDHFLDAKIVMADAVTMLAALQIMEDSRIRGLLSLRKAWKSYKEILSEISEKGSERDPLVVSAGKFGGGLFHFILSLIPPGLPQKVAAVAGFQGGDKGLGISYLRDCYDSDSIRSSLAGLILTLNHLLIAPSLDPTAKERIVEAKEIVKKGMSKYPKGSIFHAMAAIAALEENRIDEGITSIKGAIENCKHVTQYPAIFLRVLSNCYAMSLDWNVTAQILTQLLNKGDEAEEKHKSQVPWAHSWNSLRLGACYTMLGQTEDAKKHFDNCLASKNRDRWTQNLMHQATKFMKIGGGFAMFELMSLTGHYEKMLNHSDRAHKDKVLGILEKAASNSTGALIEDMASKPPEKGGFFSFLSRKPTHNDEKIDNRISYLVLKGTVLRTMGKNEEAIVCFQEVIDFEPHLVDMMYFAAAHLQMGKTVFKTDTKAAAEHFQIVLKLGNFPWDNQLKIQSRNSLRQLGIEHTPAAEESTEEPAGEDEVADLLRQEENERT